MHQWALVTANTELIDYKTLCELDCVSYVSLVTYVHVYYINMKIGAALLLLVSLLMHSVLEVCHAVFSYCLSRIGMCQLLTTSHVTLPQTKLH